MPILKGLNAVERHQPGPAAGVVGTGAISQLMLQHADAVGSVPVGAKAPNRTDVDPDPNAPTASVNAPNAGAR